MLHLSILQRAKSISISMYKQTFVVNFFFFFDRTAVYGEKKLLCCFNCKTLGDL